VAESRLNEQHRLITNLRQETIALSTQVVKLEEDLELSVGAKEEWIKTMYRLRDNENDTYNK